MPNQLPPNVVEYLRAQGYSDEDIAKTVPVQPQQTDQSIGTGSTVLRNLKAKAGGYLGGGVGTLAGAEGGALLGAPGGPVGVGIGAVIGGIAGGMGGSAAGQKAQEAITPEETYNRLQQEAQEANAANPKTGLATDIITSALAAGGRPSTDALTGGKAVLGRLLGKGTEDVAQRGIENQAILGTAINAGANPAINTGISLATGQGMPSATELGAQALGGAVFNKQFGWASKLTGHSPAIAKDEPNQEVNNSSEAVPNKTDKAETFSPFNALDENGAYQINDKELKKLYVDKMSKDVPEGTDPILAAQIKTANAKLERIPVDDMRDQLHSQALEEMNIPKEPETAEPTVKIPDQTKAQDITGMSQEDLDKELNPDATLLNKASDIGAAFSAKGSTDLLYQKIFQAINEGKDTVSGVKEPLIQEAAPFIKSGKITNAQELKDWVQGGKQQIIESEQQLKAEPTPEPSNSTTPVEAPKEQPKVLSDNSMRIINPDKLLQPDINRPEVRPEPAKLPILPKEQIQNKTDSQLESDYQKYQDAGKEAINNNDLQNASNLITQAQWHREEIQNRGNAKPTLSDRADEIADRFEKLKFKAQPGQFYFGVPHAIWNTAMEAGRLVMKAGGKIADAIDAVIKHIKANHQGQFDEPAVRQHLDEEFNGRKPATQNIPPDKYMSRVGRTTRAVIDKIHDLGTKAAHTLADGMKLAMNHKDNLIGKYKNPIIEAGKGLSKGELAQIDRAFEARRQTKQNTVGMIQSQRAKQFYNLTYKLLDELGKERIAEREPVRTSGGLLRLLKQDPNYVPTMPNQKVMDIIRNHTDPSQVEALHKSFVDYNMKLKLSKNEAEEHWDNFKKALQGDLSSSEKTHMDYFNASRRAMGLPLPPEFRENNPVLNMARYMDRSAIDLSHYKFMEKNHGVLAALGVKKDAWGNAVKQNKEGGLANNQVVKAGLEQWRPERKDPTEHSLAAALTALFISGPALEAHLATSNVVKSLASTSNPIVMGRAITHAIGNIQKGYRTAVENGAVKLQPNSWSKMFDGTASAADKMNALSQVIRKISSFNNLTRVVGTGLVQSMNEVIIPSKIARAQAGSISDIKFLKNLDPSFDPSKNYTSADSSKLASRMAQYIHGTGDIRSLPAWMLNDSEVSGFFSLAHWSVAQTNNFMKDIYEPATRGDIAPLLTGMFGAAIGGYLIKEIREKVSGKRSAIPSLQELQSSTKGIEGNMPLVGYNLIAAMQYAGFGGLLSQVAKYPFDFVYKNNPQGATFPMDEIATDLGETLHHVSEAIANDPNVNWVDLAKAVGQHVLSTNFQLGRIAVNQAIDHGLVGGLPAEKKELADKMGQLRRFDMAEGLPYNDIDQGSNPYMNLEQKKFKMEQDVPKAMSELPGLVHNIMETYHDKPDVMMSKLKALKQNEYGTFPSMEQMPLSFMKYLGYLTKMEGPEKAQSELQDFLHHKVVNEVKSSVVP